MTKDYVISLEVNDSGAIQNIDKLEQSLESTNKSANSVKAELRQIQKELANLPQGSKEFDALAQKAGKLKDQINDASEAVKANAGNAFESLSNNVGNLGNRFQNLDFEGLTSDFRGISTSIKGVKLDDLSNGLKAVAGGFLDLGKALLANPIFLIGAAVAALVLNFDAIKDALDLGVNPATRELAAATAEASEQSKKALDSFDLEERRLRALGKTEEEISVQRRALTVQRIKDLRAEAQAQAAIANEQLAEREKNRQSGLLGTLSAAFGPSAEDVTETIKNATAIQNQVAELDVVLLELDKKATDRKISNQQKVTSSTKTNNDERIREAKRLADEEARIASAALKEAERLAKETAKIAEQKERARLDALVKANEERIKIEEAQFQIEQDLVLTQQEKEVAAVTAKYDKLFEIAQGNVELEKQLTEQRNTDIAAINQQAVDQEIANQKRLSEQRIGLATGVLGAIQAINESFTAKSAAGAKRQFEINKAIGISQALIQTYQSATAAYNSQLTIPSPDAPVRAAVAAGVAVATGLAQVNKIRQTKFDGGGGGGGSISTGGASGGGGGQSGPPTFNPLNTAFLQNRPPQAAPTYVISGTVTNAQQADQKINELARL